MNKSIVTEARKAGMESAWFKYASIKSAKESENSFANNCISPDAERKGEGRGERNSDREGEERNGRKLDG